MTRQGFQTEVTLPALFLLVKARRSKRSYFLHSFFLQNNTTKPSNRSNFPHRFCFQNDTASQFYNRIYTSCVAAVSKMTRQTLQTITTSRIASALKMTRRPFQREFVLPALLLLAKWQDKYFKQEQLPRQLSASQVCFQNSLPADVLWDLLVTHSFLPHGDRQPSKLPSHWDHLVRI